MTVVHDLFGGSAPAVPSVPPVTFYARPKIRDVRSERGILCGHCVMNADRWRTEQNLPAERRTLAAWRTKSCVTILEAAVRITQVDGSTLDLCAQHAQEHTNRGNHHG